MSTSTAGPDQLLLDSDWRIEAVGAHAARRLRLTHLERAKIPGHRLWEILPRLVGTRTETLLRTAMRSREPMNFEWLFLPEITLDVRVERASNSLILRVREIASSDRASLLAPPANASSRFTPAALANVASNPEPAYACSALGRFISANDLALELFDRAPAAVVIGRKFTQLSLPRDSAAQLQHRIDLALLSGEPDVVEVLHPDGHGKLARYRHHLTPIRDPEGGVRSLIGVARLAPDPSPAKPAEAPQPPARPEPLAPPTPVPAAATASDVNATSLHRYHALCEVAVALPKDNLRKAPLFGALQRFARAIDAEIYLLHTASADGSQLRFEASGGVSYEDLGTAANPAIGEGLCGVAARDDWPVVIEDVQHNDTPEAAEPRAWGARAVVCHPLAIGSRLLGTLVFATTSRDRFSPDELAFMRDAAGLVAGSLET
ncbi:MAG TPA: PAS domain-containing protein, partial [Opitutus sp.]|nr:PAS domain-containing protein [Opitutus sp.]